MPTRNIKHGKTNHYQRFDPKHKDLVHFENYLQSPDGAIRPKQEASRIVSDVNKFLCFSNKSTLDFNNLLIISNLRSYTDKLQKDGIGPDGIITKLQRLQMAMSYIIKCDDPPSDIVSKVQTVVARVTQW